MISHGPEKRQLTGLTEVLAPFSCEPGTGVGNRRWTLRLTLNTLRRWLKGEMPERDPVSTRSIARSCSSCSSCWFRRLY